MGKKKGKATAKSAISPEKPRIQIDYIKSGQFRTVHVDGAHGGPTPQGRIQMAIYSERLPIPQQVIHEIQEDRIGAEVARKIRSDVVREVEVNLIMEPDLARQVAQLLLNHADQIDKMHAASGRKKTTKKKLAKKVSKKKKG